MGNNQPSARKKTYYISLAILAGMFFIFGFVSWVNSILIPYFRISCELTYFESYFVEEIIKEIKENMTLDDEEKDGSLATLTDYNMDFAIKSIAKDVVDEVGQSFTQQLYEQMKRNYGIE